MVSIHKQEELIFEKCQALLGDGGEVSADGLHYLGEFYYEKGYWKRKPGNEERDWKLYCARKRGLVILTKDLNDEEAWDIREEHGRKNEVEEPTPSNCGFYRNLRRWIYGLLSMNNEGLMPEFPATYIAQECFERKPWVRMNLKKIPGSSSISNQELNKNIQDFRSLLLEQLVIYKDASIYLDCTHRHGIKLLRENLYSDIKAFGAGEDDWIYFSEEQHFFIVNSYHPSYCIPGGEEAYYDRMKDAIHSFFQEYPTFL